MSGFLVRLLTLAAIVAAATGITTAQAQQVDCRFFKVVADGGVNVFTEPRSDASFIGRLNRDEIVCVAGDQQVGDRKWAYVPYRVLGGDQHKTFDGWGIMSGLQPASQGEVAAARDAPPSAAELRPPPPAAELRPLPARPEPLPPPGPPVTAVPPPLEPAPRAEAGASGDESIRFSEPIRGGGYPVEGHSLEELVRGVPEFPPIEGLPEDVWRKTCDNCHQWNRQSLCVQARIYAGDEKMAFRKQHPYGGPEKVAMMKWARQGCQ